MAPAAPTLFDLLGDPTAAWPSDHVHEHPGVPLDGQADPTVWLAALNASVRVHDVRTGADADRVALQAQLTVDPTAGFLSYPAGWPFVIGSMPDVEFRVQPYPQSGRSVGMFISAGDSGVELVLEGLPVEIRLPPELVAPHPDEPGDPSGGLVVEVGEFEAGRLDDLKVILRRGDVTSIFVHVRLTMTESFEFHLQPAVPISFGRCALSAIPCAAVHDFRLLPSPRLAREREEWLRHTVEPWLPSHTAAFDGLVAVRSVDVDEQAQGLKDVVQWLNGHARDTDPTADFVLDDLVVPFHGPFWLPVPRHLTVGIRRKVLDPASKEQVYAFEGAPVHLVITDDHRIAFNVESFFYRSQPSENLDKDLGLTFSAALVFGPDSAPQQALEIGLDEDYTIVTGYKRDFAPGTTGGPPVPGPGPKPKTNELLHWEVAGTVIADVMAIRAGFSLGRYLSGSSWPDSLLLTIDVFVSLPPTGKDTSTFRLRSLNGEKVAFAIEGLGWRLGSLHLEGLALPDGVVAYIANVALVIAELGLKAEDGASYLSFSGGLLVELPSGLKGGVTVRRLRFRVAGNQSRPSVKFDGFFLSARNRDASVVFEGGGAYGQDGDDTNGGREFRFTATLTFDLGQRKYTFGVDFLIGDRYGPDGRFDYLLVQAFFRATIGPLGAFELTGARVLYGRNLLPLLQPVDRESRELRYYRWYRENDPLTVPGDRRLAGWRPERDSWSFGIGASASLPALGKLVELTVFVLGLRGASEQGALVVGEVYALKNTKPLGFLALELDRRNDRYSLLIGVDARASSFVTDAPAWMDGVGNFTGTLFLSNDPSTVAIGRLADQATWLQLRFDVDLFLKSSLVIGFCLELVEDGPKGFGLVVRVEGGIGVKGILRASYNAGISVAVLVFTTGSTDYAAVISIEAGFRIVLFGFLRIGVSATIDFRVVGAHPARGELSAALKLETPWFLPDYTLRIEFQFGELAPGELATAVAPLRSAGAVEPGAQRQLPTHLERFDPSWNGEGVAPVHSVVELQAPTRSEAERLANLAADAELRPVATDATIGVTFSVAVNDRLALGVGVASGLGNQQSGDLGLTYDLVGIAVRRRARFGPDLAWKPLEQRVELGPDFSDPGGVQLNGSFGPQILNKTWDVGVRVGGAVAPKKLLLGGVAPYEFTTRDPEADEELVRRFPAWPCCQPPSEKDLEDRLHRLDWHGMRAGEALDGPRTWRFTGATSTLRFLRPAWTRPVVSTGLPAGTIVAAASFGAPGIVARADFDEDVAFCRVRLAWPRGTRATLVAFDGAGDVVGRMELDFGTDGVQVFVLGASGPIRRLELRGFRPGFGVVAAASASPAAAITGSMLEVDEVAYVGLRDYLDLLVLEGCDGSTGGGYEGKGKLAFLPNHEYELQLTTRVTIAHPSTPPTSADVDEFVYFRTKGLPGLNAVARAGDELEPYVLGAYAGGRGGLVYREEPVTLAFSEGFLVAVPLEARDPGSADEHATLLRMQLVMTPDVAAGAQTAFTVTAEDWGRRAPPQPAAAAARRSALAGRAEPVAQRAERDGQRRPGAPAARGGDPARRGAVPRRRSAACHRHGARGATPGQSRPRRPFGRAVDGAVALHGGGARRGRRVRRPPAVRGGRRAGVHRGVRDGRASLVGGRRRAARGARRPVAGAVRRPGLGSPDGRRRHRAGERGRGRGLRAGGAGGGPPRVVRGRRRRWRLGAAGSAPARRRRWRVGRGRHGRAARGHGERAGGARGHGVRRPAARIGR